MSQITKKINDIENHIPHDLFDKYKLSELRELSAKELFDLGKITLPLFKSKEDETYRVIQYEEAIKIIAERMKGLNPRKSFFYASGRSSNEASFLLELFAKIIGSNNVITCSNYCHEASGIALQSSLGSDYKSIPYKNLEKSDLIFIIGANPTSNHPRFTKILKNHNQKGKKVIVINPSLEPELSKYATHYYQPNIGGDVALFTGISKFLIENEKIDLSKLKNIDGYNEYKAFIKARSWTSISAESGLKIEDILFLGEQYLKSNRTVFSWGMGLTHHINGTDNIESIINLSLLRGMTEGDGRGLLPLRWHDNAPQAPFMGFSSDIKKRIYKSLESTFDIKLPDYKGMDTLSCMQSSLKGKIEFAFLLGGNLFSVNPDRDFSKKALGNLPFKVMLNSTLNETNLFGINGDNLILPIKINGENNINNNLRSEVEIISDIATKSISNQRIHFNHFKDHKNIKNAVSKMLPRLDLSENNSLSDKKHNAIFRIPTEKIRKANQKGVFNLSSVRSEGQFNTMIYDEADVFRSQKSRDVLFISAEDIEALGMSDGSIVDISSESGCLKEIKLAEYNIRPGNVMTYMPEANILIPQNADKRSKTPSFKSVSVTISNH